MTLAGYILGFPADTPERSGATSRSSRRSCRSTSRVLLPDPAAGLGGPQGPVAERGLDGSRPEHLRRRARLHRASADEQARSGNIYRERLELYYTPEHMRTLLRRAAANGLFHLAVSRPDPLTFAAPRAGEGSTRYIPACYGANTGTIGVPECRSRRSGVLPALACETACEADPCPGDLLIWRLSFDSSGASAGSRGDIPYMDQALTPVCDDETRCSTCSRTTTPLARRSPMRTRSSSSPAPTALRGPKPPREAEALPLIDARQDARGPRHVAAVLVAEGVDHQRLLASDAQKEQRAKLIRPAGSAI